MAGLTNVRIPSTAIGLGSIQNIGNEALKLGATRTLIITDKGILKAGLLDNIKISLEKANLKYDVFDGCQPEPPVNIIELIASKIKSEQYDLLIGVGGGSNMDATKAASVFAYGDISLSTFIKSPRGTMVKGKVVPKILVPTTAGTGAEWSLVAVVYDEHNLGIPGAMEQYWADKVIIDPELTRNLPQKITADTGFDALTHAIEAYTCANANAFSDMFATTAIKTVGENIRLAYSKGTRNIEARYYMSFAASIAMNAAVTGGMGLCHVLNEELVSKAHISHGSALAILLPSVMEFNLISAPHKFAKVAELLGEDIQGLSEFDAGNKSIQGVKRLIHDLGLPKRMSDIGLNDDDIASMAKQCYDHKLMIISLWNPRDVNEKDIYNIFKAAL
jgi:alcohol dehydrogenase class IV